MVFTGIAFLELFSVIEFCLIEYTNMWETMGNSKKPYNLSNCNNNQLISGTK